jgi:hypothetical protein
MTVEIHKNAAVDIAEVIRNSPVRDDPDANAVLSGYMASSSETWVGFWNTEIACICGLIPPSILSNRAYLWMINTDLVDKHQFLFVRHSQMWLGELLDRYESIHGHCQVANTKGLKWLSWLGARFDEPIGGCLPFQIRRKDG